MVFESVGCATCHAPKLGDVNGLYSDLLLHDMGESSSDSATYYGVSNCLTNPQRRGQGHTADATIGNGRTDRVATPPLWGVADSAPYMHDGRAVTLDDAIRRHDGEATRTRIRFTRLTSGDARPCSSSGAH